MYDTVAAAIDLPQPLDEQYFQDGESRTRRGVTVRRMWYNTEYVRLTYWRQEHRQECRLRAEFSIPHVLGLGYENPTTAQAYAVLDDVSRYTNQLLRADIPHLRGWKAQRIDYAWNWECGDDLPLYLGMAQRLNPPGMQRQVYPHSGVVFKGQQKHGRWIKFYDKGKEQGEKDKRVLRFEVQNMKAALPYMCERWYSCTRLLSDLLHPGRALYCMAVAWDKLGLSHAHAHYGDDEASLLLRLRRDFGAAAPGALYALLCIRAYGAETHKSLGLMSSNSYYTHRRKLTEHNYMIDTQYHMPSLSLPYDTVMKEQTFAAAQNLGDGGARPAKTDPKNFAEKLGVRPDARLPKYLQREARRAAA